MINGNSLLALKPRPLVLVIEDEPGDAQLILLQLLEREQDAFDVRMVDSLAAAQRMIDVDGVLPDVVLLDLNLPDSAGIATVEKFHAMSDAPVVVLTGVNDLAATETAIQSGAEDYLAKGCDGAALRKAIRYAMLRYQRDTDARLAATVFAHAREGIVIAATDGTILKVNETFSRITGYSSEESIGRNLRFLKSGHHEPEFYQAMWNALIERGHWYGEIWNRRKNGEVYAEMITISEVRDARGKVRHYVSLFSDITVQKEHELQLEHIAHYDALTTLPNRVLLADRLEQARTQTKRRGQRLAVAYLDLDGFKAINDNHGHEAGDQLLVAVAIRMKQSLRDGDTIARIGGDEFVAVLLDLADIEASVPMLSRLLDAAAMPVQVGALTLQISASLGLTFYPQQQDIDAGALLRQADQAMYQAKLAGRNRYYVFDTGEDRSIRDHHENLNQIRRAIDEHAFMLHYQPKVNMRSGKILGVEALIRWQHPERGLLLPAMFLPAIEGHPLTIELGEWVIDAALTQIEAWRTAGIELPVSVNIGAQHIQQTNFMDRLRQILAAHPRLRKGDLELELMETSAQGDTVRVSEVIGACREIGVNFALDDFGAGHSSLTYLKDLPVNEIKINQNFVRDMLDDRDDLAILVGVLGIATALDRHVVAEGVEGVEHGKMLLQLGCELGQGDGIACPMPASEVQGWMANWHPEPVWTGTHPVSQESLPMLYAAVEHRAWIAAVEDYIRGKRESAPELDSHQCRFGAWLDADGLVLADTRPAFATVELLHRQAHALVVELCRYQAGDRKLEAKAGLGELHVLRDRLLENLRELVR
jgi:diguanylate cyclase (GGDEF)-like protein/PAS domain S-box-containing protein